jgi:hypothetical protein
MIKQMKLALFAMFAALAALAAPVAQAAVDAGVTTALSDAKTDVGVIGLAVFVIAVAIVLYKWFKRAL